MTSHNHEPRSADTPAPSDAEVPHFPNPSEKLEEAPDQSPTTPEQSTHSDGMTYRRVLGWLGVGLAALPLAHNAYHAGAEVAAEHGRSYSVGQFINTLPDALSPGRSGRYVSSANRQQANETLARTYIAGEDGKWHAQTQGVNTALAAGMFAGIAIATGSRRKGKAEVPKSDSSDSQTTH